MAVHSTILKSILGSTQILYGMLGIVLVVAAVYGKSELSQYELGNLFPQLVITLIIATGAVIIFLGAVGLITTIKAGSRLLLLWLFFLFGFIGFEIYVAIYASDTFTNDRDQLLSDVWNTADDNARRTIQNWTQCCGFANTTDRVSSPCPANATIGCFDAVRDRVFEPSKTAVYAGSWGLLGYEIVMIILSMVLMISLVKGENSKQPHTRAAQTSMVQVEAQTGEAQADQSQTAVPESKPLENVPEVVPEGAGTQTF